MGFDYKKAFSRNNGLLTNKEQEILKNATVGIPGMGGVGGIHLITLARMGIAKFHIADADRYELANFNRQHGAFMTTIGKNKAEVMHSLASDINPEADIKKWDKFIDEENIDEFLENCDLVIDSIDAFCVDQRRLLHTKAQEKGIPIISAGPIGFSCSMIVIMPGGVSFDDYFDWQPSDDFVTKMTKFLKGLTPEPLYRSYMDFSFVNFERKYGPSVASAVTLCAGFAATEAVKILLKKPNVYPLPYYHYYDPFLMRFKRGYNWLRNKNPIKWRIK